ncbi:MAG: ribonuclease HII [Candidatus Moraniibacteriota bacterium]
MTKEKMISTFDLEERLLTEGFDFVIGVDEAGRGPLAGPVVAAAVVARKLEITNYKLQTNSKKQTSSAKEPVLNDREKASNKISDEEKMWDLIKDSKKLSEKRREEVFDFIMRNFYVGVGICDHQTIDRINILEATFLAMKKAIGDLKNKLASEKNNRMIVLVDGDKIIPNFSIEQKSIVSGDKSVKSISAASIIAKVTRDRMLGEFDKKYPQYQFAKHKGYGTKIHIEALKEFGPCEIHRRTFAPVRNAINNRWKK